VSTKSDPTSLWRPLRSSTFRNLLLANVASDIGTFMQSVGAAWLMVKLGGGPMFVALIQAAVALPFFALALPAGAVGDICDRRKVILLTEIWMAFAALALATLTLASRITPVLLLVLTCALSAGDAFESPSWRAILPELVGKDDLPSASALNSIEFNFARAVGPALGGVLVAFAGAGASFLVNVVSFLGVIVVVARWRRVVAQRVTPPETVTGATVAALRYVRYSPAIKAMLLRIGTTMFFANALLALLPSVASRVNGSAVGYGMLLGAFGCGAVLGALVMQRARSRWSGDVIISAGIAAFGLATLAAGALHQMVQLVIVLLIGGSSWILFISLYNVQSLNRAPDWVRARVLAVQMLVFQGAIAAGSATWGVIAQRAGLNAALLIAGAGTLLSIIVGFFLRVPDSSIDLTSWSHWRLPIVVTENAEKSGPVLVVAEYEVQPEQASEFIGAMRQYSRSRRRDGASRWELCRDFENPDHYLETFVVDSWAEHVRQHERAIRDDRRLEERVRSCTNSEPHVRHLQYL